MWLYTDPPPLLCWLASWVQTDSELPLAGLVFWYMLAESLQHHMPKYYKKHIIIMITNIQIIIYIIT